MSFFNNIILNFILINFPIICYLFFRIYFDKKDESLFISSVFISILFIFIFSNKYFYELSLFIYILLVLCYIKKNKSLAIFVSLFLIFINYYFYEINIYLLVVEYIIYFINYIKLENNISNFINRFIIIRSFFLSFYLFYLYYDISLDLNVLYLLLYIIISYLLFYSYNYLVNNNISFNEFNRIKKKVQTEDGLKDYLCAVTHELKNSLTITKGYLDMINNKKKQKEYLGIIKKEVNRSIDMIQEGFNLSKNRINYEILDINLLLEDVSDTLKGIFKNRKIKYKINYIDDDIYVLGDYEKLKQVFINILKNSVESKDSNLKIEISNEIIKDNICISIKDNGEGILDVDNMHSNKELGMGLGTTISKNIVDKHNGKIIYESNKDEGTIVNVLLPIFK